MKKGRKAVSCKDYYEYVMRQLERVGEGNISIYGDMPKKCWDYFKRRGIRVTKGLWGYLKFEKVYYQKQGIKTHGRYSKVGHHYIEDYGFSSTMRSLRKEFPEVCIDDTLQKTLAGYTTAKIEVTPYSSSNPTVKLEAIYDFDEHRWYFFDKRTGRYVNIKKLLRALSR